MSEERKYKLISFSLIAVLLLIISILLIYVSQYDLSDTARLETNYASLVFGMLTWGGFIGTLIKLWDVYDHY